MTEIGYCVEGLLLVNQRFSVISRKESMTILHLIDWIEQMTSYRGGSWLFKGLLGVDIGP